MKRIAPVVLILAWASVASAEVAVVLDDKGNFASFRSDSFVRDGKVYYWERAGSPQDFYLNQDGDARGDRAPVALVVPAGRQRSDPTPYVVWPWFDGSDLEIYWSRWLRGTAWSTPKQLGLSNTVDDQAPDVFLDPRGDVHAVWWTNTTIPGVYYSKFVAGAWSTALLLSDPTVDSREPRFSFGSDILYVTYTERRGPAISTRTLLKEDFDP